MLFDNNRHPPIRRRPAVIVSSPAKCWIPRRFVQGETEPPSGSMKRNTRASISSGPSASSVTVTRHDEASQWFLNDLRLVTPGRSLKSSTNSTRALLMRPDRAEIYEQRIVRLLQSADLGVARLDTDPETGEIRLWHRTPDGGEAPLDFSTEESLGTHAWFAFLEPMLTVLDRGSVLLVDELRSCAPSRTPRRIRTTRR